LRPPLDRHAGLSTGDACPTRPLGTNGSPPLVRPGQTLGVGTGGLTRSGVGVARNRPT
jgi:hypothetical protein